MRNPYGKLVGKGAFSKVYRIENNPEVTIVSSDPIKECMSMGWFPDSPLFPKIERIEYLDNGKSVYTMLFYESAKSKTVIGALTEHNQKLYRLLKTISELVRRKLFNCHFNDSYEKWLEGFQTLPDTYKDEREALIEAVEASTNYGSDIMFEISPRNVACVDGQLVLLDCFFMRSALMALR